MPNAGCHGADGSITARPAAGEKSAGIYTARLQSSICWLVKVAVAHDLLHPTLVSCCGQEPKRRCRRELDGLGGAEFTLAAYVPRAASSSAAAAISSALLTSPHRAAQHPPAAAALPVKPMAKTASSPAKPVPQAAASPAKPRPAGSPIKQTPQAFASPAKAMSQAAASPVNEMPQVAPSLARAASQTAPSPAMQAPQTAPSPAKPQPQPLADGELPAAAAAAAALTAAAPPPMAAGPPPPPAEAPSTAAPAQSQQPLQLMDQQVPDSTAAPRSRPSRAFSRRNAAAAELAALIKEEERADLPRLRSRGASAPTPAPADTPAAQRAPASPRRHSCHAGAGKGSQKAAPPTEAAIQTAKPTAQPGDQQLSTIGPAAQLQGQNQLHSASPVHKGSKELRMLTADMDPQPALPARRSQNPAAAAGKQAAADQQPAPSGQPAAAAALPKADSDGGAAPVRRSHKRKDADGPSAVAAAEGHQKQQSARKVRPRVSKVGAAQAAADTQKLPGQPTGNGIPLPGRTERSAVRDQSPAAPSGSRQKAEAAPAPAKADAVLAVPSADLTALVDRCIEVLKPQPGSQVRCQSYLVSRHPEQHPQTSASAEPFLQRLRQEEVVLQVGLRQVMASGLLAGRPLAFCDRQKQPKLHGEH